MKIWTIFTASLLVAGVKSIALVLGMRDLPLVETVVILIGLIIYLKLAALPNKSRYLVWSVSFLILTVIFVSLIDLLLNKVAFNLYDELANAGIILVDFVAGALFGFSYRLISKKMAQKRA